MLQPIEIGREDWDMRLVTFDGRKHIDRLEQKLSLGILSETPGRIRSKVREGASHRHKDKRRGAEGQSAGGNVAALNVDSGPEIGSLRENIGPD